MNRRVKPFWVALVLPLTIFGLITSSALAQTYPNKPIRIVVPMPPGGAVDMTARLIGQKLTENLGQPVLVDNRAGGGGSIGPDVVAKAPPDGYTILLMSSSSLISGLLLSSLPYDMLKDFAPVTELIAGPMVLIGSMSLPAKSAKELIALAKSKPGKINYASDGVGSIGHLGMELFKSMAGIDMVHVPYKGQAPSIVDMLAGRVDVKFAGIAPSLPYVRSGRLRALGTGATKLAQAAPEFIPIEKDLPGFECVSWHGVLAPAGTPREIIMKLNTELVKILSLPDIKNRMAQDIQEIVGNTPEEFGDVIKKEKEKWGKVIKDHGIRAD
jgi:tripartite-type tricarboxylate transporter receptor subunit TctC